MSIADGDTIYAAHLWGSGTSFPGSPVAGQYYYRSDLDVLFRYIGSSWKIVKEWTPATYSPAGGATATLDVSLNVEHRITMPAGNITIAISNEVNGMKFLISILQDATGSRTVTWFTTIRWADGSAPTLTTTASKRDIFGFIVTGTDTYDGFVIGQAI
jgi:hypothetical protein